MSEIYRSACPLDCFDGCGFKVSVENGIIKRIDGDVSHPFTRGFICPKGRALADRIYGPHRLRHPLLKREGKFVSISWDEAYDIIVKKLDYIKRNFSTLSVAHYYESGSGGLLRSLDNRFFNIYGGVSECSGSLCWGAGNSAQTMDFGMPLSHKPDDMLNSKLIVLWGRNPVYTNIHLVPFIERARKKGAKVLLIDPIATASTKLADYYYSIKAGSDALLALGLAKTIIERGKEDRWFISNRTNGYEKYLSLLKGLDMGWVLHETGLCPEDILNIAGLLMENRPATCYIGYGMQRHAGGGNAVRAIDALWAVLGNVGVRGGGVNYSHRLMSRYIDDGFYAADRATAKREFLRGEMATFLEEADPPVKALFVTRANPLRQIPDTGRLIKALNKIDFKVTLDLFMTDTCEVSDMVLPVTSFLEEEDVIYTTMSRTYLNYAERVIDRIGEARPEWEIFADIAERMGLEGFPHLTSEEWLEMALRPLKRHGITLEDIKKGYIEPPGSTEIPWQDGFMTESGKFEFLNFDLNIRAGDGDEGYTYRLITPHPKDSLHSQSYVGIYDLPYVYINTGEAEKMGILDGDKVLVTSPSGELEGLARPSRAVPVGTVMIYEGQYGVNRLTPIATADLGGQAAIYDARVNIRRL
jgi:Molydopterin dinucleotide binding domain./Molybdopterin oxidoreductase Fe4S4 domain./Molybdopterin oxidoreductase.